MRYPGAPTFHKMIHFRQSVATSPFAGSAKMKRRRISGLMSSRFWRQWQERRCQNKVRVAILILASFDNLCTLLKRNAGHLYLDTRSKAARIEGMFANTPVLVAS